MNANNAALTSGDNGGAGTLIEEVDVAMTDSLIKIPYSLYAILLMGNRFRVSYCFY